MIIVFAGTSDARQYVYDLLKEYDEILVCVVTDYAKSLYKDLDGLTVLAKKQDKQDIVGLIEKYNPEKIFDATHPYASEISCSLKEICEKYNIIYIQKTRESYFDFEDEDVLFFEGYEDCAKYLADIDGKILLTIGSRRLKYFTDLIDIDRMVARVLSLSKVLSECEQLGFFPKNIIAAQGPFSKKNNIACIVDNDIKYLVTKDSGIVGGVHEKFVAAKECNAKILVIKKG